MLHTYKINGKLVSINAKKDTAGRIAHILATPFALRSTWRELSGVRGVTEGYDREQSSVMSVLFGTSEYPIADPAKYNDDCAAYLESLPDTMTQETAAPFMLRAREICDEHMPINDRRQDREERAAEAAKQKNMIDEANSRAAESTAAWVKQYGDSDTAITTPDGMMPVVIEMNYNDSDSQSDYYSPHCGYKNSFLLGYVKKGSPRKESTMREIMGRFPELAALKWEFGKEDYSMGHGYWLESEVVAHLPEITTYAHENGPAAWWEISFGGWEKSLYPFRGYAASTGKPETKTAAKPTAKPAQASPADAINARYAWVEKWEADPEKKRYKSTISNARVNWRNELAALS